MKNCFYYLIRDPRIPAFRRGEQSGGERGSQRTSGKLKPKFGDLALGTGCEKGDGGRICIAAWSLQEGLGT